MPMMRPIRSAASLAIALSLCGCGGGPALGPGGQPVMASGRTAGISWTLMGEGAVEHNETGKALTAKLGPNTLEIKANKLTVNGVDLGRVSEGDSVIVDTEGKVTVNAVPRTAADAQAKSSKSKSK